LQALAVLALVAAGVAVSLSVGMQADGVARFLPGLQRTFRCGGISVPPQISLALALAALLFAPIRGRVIDRVLLLPRVTPTVAGAAVDRTTFSPREERLVNTRHNRFGIKRSAGSPSRPQSRNCSSVGSQADSGLS